MKVTHLTKKEVVQRAEDALRGVVPITRDDQRVTVYGVPRGGMILSMMLPSPFIPVADPNDADVILDDIIDSGRTRNIWAAKQPSIPFVAAVNKHRQHPDADLGWVVFPWEEDETPERDAEHHVQRILEHIGDDPRREGLIETPERVVRSWNELYAGYGENPAAVLKTFQEGACNEMVLLKNIEFYSTCEHHMLPFFGKAHIAYIPNGRVVGVSKLARLLDIFARRLQIQERIGQQVTQTLMDELKPLGAACILEAQHFCMTSRGVQKQDSVMVTSSLTGVFLDKYEARCEFLSLVKG